MSRQKEKRSLGFTIAYPLLWLIARLPLALLYGISNFLFIIVAGFGYRRKVINKNLKNSFPDKSELEIRKIRIGFYRHFCDLFAETIALIHIDIDKIQKRVEVCNPEVMQELLKEGKDVVAILGHYCNWEWTPVVSRQYQAEGLSVYRPLKNKDFDKMMLDIRGRFGSRNIPLHATAREIVRLKQQNRRFVLGLISDQSPSKFELNYWTTFLNQNTAVILGPEKMAKLTRSKVVYWQLEKIKRGRYRMTYIPYPGDVASSPEFDITEWHVRLLENQIKKAPQYWLWSHKRWKYSYLYKSPNL